jgi:rSAM/selenodomain-associated transferase 2
MTFYTYFAKLIIMEKISVIIPSYNEKKETLLKCVRSLSHDAVAEIIIAQSGEGDLSVDDPKVKFIRSERSRPVQMNKGAQISTGGILLFMHADSSLDAACIDEALQILKNEKISMGAFSLKYDDEKRRYRVLEFGVRLRNRIFNLPYGDQCYFLRRDGFLSAGGFDEVPILEDVRFVKKLKRRGGVKIATSSVTTSPRRYEKNGFIKNILKNYFIMLLYNLRFSPRFIARFY